MNIKFVSYDGAYPNLCSGTLTLEFDSEKVQFGNRTSSNGRYPSFWSSGGSCGFAGADYTNEYVTSGPWRINARELPEQYRPYADQIAEIFNANVPCGCCGGCL